MRQPEGMETAFASLLEQVASLRGGPSDEAAMALAVTTVAAGLMPPLHAHESEEGFHVLAGTLRVYAGTPTFDLEAGESYVAPSRVPHTLCATSRSARVLTMAYAESAGAYEDYVRALGAPVGAGGPEPTPEELAALLALAAPAGIEVLGPPGTLPTDVEPRAA